MRLLLVSEHEEFTEKIKTEIRGQGHQLGIFATIESLLQSKDVLEFDCAICEEKTFSRLKSHFQNPIFILTATNLPQSWVTTLQQGADGIVYYDVPVPGMLAQVAA